MAIPRPQIAPNAAKKKLSDQMLDELAKRAADKVPVTAARPPAESQTRTDLVDKLRPTDGWKAKVDPKDPPRAKDESDLDYLARLRAEQERVRKASEDELKAGKAKAQLDAGARAGAAGMGLSGATAALQSDIGRQQDRGAVLALNELDQAQNTEEFQAIQREGAIMDYEDAYDIDMDGDGKINGIDINLAGGIGDGDPDNNPEDEEAFQNEDQRKEKLATENAKLDSWDHSVGDDDTDPGTAEEPFIFKGNIRDLKAYLRANGAGPTVTEIQVSVGGVPGMLGQTETAFVDSFGNVYLLDRR